MQIWRKEPTPPKNYRQRGTEQGHRKIPLRNNRNSATFLKNPGIPVHYASRPTVHVVLFISTLFSMTAAGTMQRGVNPFNGFERLVHLVEGIPFAATLLAILTVHEFGHYFAARRWGVKASLPYFIPLPYISFLGTLGAVIQIRTPIPHKRALLDIGASGPLAGFVVALLACLIGLPQSRVVTASYFEQLPFLNPEPFWQLGAPLVFTALSAWLVPPAETGNFVLLSPMAFAGWVGLFITAFNLFPVGQLDGGHISYAVFGTWHHHISRTTFALLLGLGAYGIFARMLGLPPGWPGWIFLAILLTLLGKSHPAPFYPNIPLDRKRQRIGAFCFLVFAVCFTPVPFSN